MVTIWSGCSSLIGGEALEQLGELRPNAGQGGHRREERIEDGGTHKGSLYPRRGIAKSTC